MIERKRLQQLFQEANDQVEARRYDQALDLYRRVLLLAGEEDELAAEYAHWGIGELSLCLGDYWTAIRSLRQALRINPLEAAYHFLLGVVLERIGAHAEALTSLARAYDLEPDRPRVVRA